MGSDTPFYSYNELVVLAEKSVQSRGEQYVYPSGRAINMRTANFEFGKARGEGTCVYMFGLGKPGCLVGDMMYTAGLITQVPRWNCGTGIAQLLEEGRAPFETDQKGKEFLNCLQDQQDSGNPWGKALSIARVQIEALFPEEQVAA